MSLICENKPAMHLPTKAREVYDVTGAGDTVIATLGASIAAGEDFVITSYSIHYTKLYECLKYLFLKQVLRLALLANCHVGLWLLKFLCLFWLELGK